MGETPLISVIIPVYNVGRLLNRCVSSVCGQTYDNLEIIIVDDGSTDGSAEACDTWSSQDSRINVFHKPNGGLSDARNFGIERSTGDYLMFVDSDDYIASNMVECLQTLLAQSNADIAVCDPVHVYGDICEFSDSGSPKVYSSHDAIVEMLYQSSFLVSAWGKLYKASCFASLRFPVGKLFEDSAIMYRVFETVPYVLYTPARLYAYCHRDNSITTRAFDRKDLDIWDICREMEEHYRGASEDLTAAVRSYKMSAALRILLNASDDVLGREVDECAAWIRRNTNQVARDPRVRKKTKCALLLFKMGKPCMRMVYRWVDRWA